MDTDITLEQAVRNATLTNPTWHELDITEHLIAEGYDVTGRATDIMNAMLNARSEAARNPGLADTSQATVRWTSS